MKKQFRILAAALALCLSLLCCPAAFAAVDSSSCQTVPYAQATSQPLGQPITITGTPNYSAATSNDTAFIFGFDTADGVWYVAVQKSKFDAFKAAAPAQQMTLYGVYAGTLGVKVVGDFFLLSRDGKSYIVITNAFGGKIGGTSAIHKDGSLCRSDIGQ